MELFKASRQWAERPDDERFSTVGELHQACAGYREKARESTVSFKELAPGGSNGEVLLGGPNGGQARLTHWAFGQLCSRVGAPASYLRELPTSLAVQNLEHGFSKAENNPAYLMFHQENGGLLCRAVTSERYTRIWNSDVTARLQYLAQDNGWQVPPARPAREGQRGTRPATEADLLIGEAWDLSIRLGDLIAPAGLYASDHDMFAFLVNQTNPIQDKASGNALHRGFFVWNSEVGAASFGVTLFLYAHVCGNHIVWDAKEVREFRIRHVGAADTRAFKQLQVEVRKYADSSASDEQARIERAQSYELGVSKEAVIDRLFGLRIPALTRKRLDEAYDTSERNYPTYGSPRSAWGMAQGLTYISQATPYGEDRVAIDRAAGKVLSIAF